MTRSRKSKDQDKLLLARLRAEDDAVSYLSNFPREVAFVVARNVERTLATRWEAEQEKMTQRGNLRDVVCITQRDKQELDWTITRIPPNAQSDADAEQHVIRILSKLSPDWAWCVARVVARYEEAKFERSQRPSTAPPDPERLIAELAQRFYQSAER
jgi:hypothetical protein